MVPKTPHFENGITLVSPWCSLFVSKKYSDPFVRDITSEKRVLVSLAQVFHMLSWLSSALPMLSWLSSALPILSWLSTTLPYVKLTYLSVSLELQSCRCVSMVWSFALFYGLHHSSYQLCAVACLPCSNPWCRATNLNLCICTVGSDEEEIIQILSSMNNEQRQQIKDYFKTAYGQVCLQIVYIFWYCFSIWHCFSISCHWK